IIAGDVAFRLYDTFGFPLDLTQVIAQARGFGVDVAGDESAMTEQRKRSTVGGSGEGGTEGGWEEVAGEVGPTPVLRHSATEGEGTVVKVIDRGGGQIAFVTDRTPFYGEQGGQIGDAGQASGEGVEVVVTDTKKPGGDLIVHFGEVGRGTLKNGAKLRLA